MAVNSFKELKTHIGHKVVCAGYALQDEQGNRQSEWQNVAVECEDCSTVLFDYDKDNG